MQTSEHNPAKGGGKQFLAGLGLFLMTAVHLLGGETAREVDRRAMERVSHPPLGLPAVPQPADQPLSAAKVRLGRKLFFDRRLSFNGTMSCGMCHIPEQGFSNNELARPIGVEGRSLRRNSPTVLNAVYASSLFHDGRETGLDTQAIGPLLAREEMANPSIGFLVAKVGSLKDYAGLFEKAFGAGPSMERVGQALAAWQRTMVSGNSPFDRWRYGGESDALAPEAKRGFELFVGKAGCARCHDVGEQFALFTDNQFHNTGIGYRSETQLAYSNSPVPVELAPGVFAPLDRSVIATITEPVRADLGRFEVTMQPVDKWRFRTPTLRNVALTAPYMHDGSLATLEEVLQFYNDGGTAHEGLDPLIKPLHLEPPELAALAAFLRSLTGDNIEELMADARSEPIGE